MPYATCQYVARSGLCGKSCWAGHKDGDRCGVHRNRESLAWCKKGCGRATRSPTGFCNKCETSQNDGCKKLRLEVKRMDEFIDEILNWGDWETFVYEPPARPQQHPSETITVQEKSSSSSSTRPLASTLGRLLQRDLSTAIQRALSEAIEAALAEDNFDS